MSRKVLISTLISVFPLVANFPIVADISAVHMHTDAEEEN